MIYPKFLKEKDTIGITAPSDGISKEIDIIRLENANKNIKKRNFNIKETESIRKSNEGRSATIKKRVSELENLYKDEETKVIICASGGEFLLEILPYINFEIIKNNPKWLQGYSDPTGLTYTITTNLDIATIYGNNYKAFGMEKWHKSLENNLEILKGNLIKQESFRKYEKESLEKIKGTESYNLTEKVEWKNITGEKKINETGRIIGGCIEVISDLFGTKYDKTIEFIEKYKNDSIIWYFDNYAMTTEELYRALWRFKENGYFKYTSLVIIGRQFEKQSFCDLNYEETLRKIFDELNIKVITEADIGHVNPRMTIINGAIAHITSEKGKGEITFSLE